MTETIISPDEVRVETAESVVHNIGGSVTYEDAALQRHISVAKWIDCPDTSKAQYYAPYAKFNMGCADSRQSHGWQIGLKIKKSGVQLREKPVFIVGCIGDPTQRQSWQTLTGAYVNPNVICTKIDDQTVRYSDWILDADGNELAQLDMVKNTGGADFKHRFVDLRQQFPGYSHYGIVWNYETGSEQIVEKLATMAGQEEAGFADTWFMQDEANDRYIEYFDASAFDNMVGGYLYHYAVTEISDLSANLELTGGTTYHMPDNTNFGGYDVTTSGTGTIYLKYTSGKGWNWGAGDDGTFIHDGGSTLSLFQTDKNDDAHGETVTGSTGTPVVRIRSFYTATSSTGYVQITNGEWWYASNYNTQFNTSTTNLDGPLIYKDITFKYCVAPATSGMFRIQGPVSVDITWDNCSFDDTNNFGVGAVTVGPDAGSHPMVTMKNCYFKDCFDAGYGILTTRSDLVLFNNIFDVDDLSTLCTWNTTEGARTADAYSNTVLNTAGAGTRRGLTFTLSSGSSGTVVAKNNIVKGWLAGIYITGTGTLTSATIEHNSYEDNDDNVDGASSGTGDEDATITFGNKTAGAVIDSLSAKPDGYVASGCSVGAGTNLANGFDSTEDSPTGTEVADGDTSQRGAYNIYSTLVQADSSDPILSIIQSSLINSMEA